MHAAPNVTSTNQTASPELIGKLNDALAREASESAAHAQIVRNTLVRLGGIAVTQRHAEEIEHTTDYQTMLEQALKTEQQSRDAYRGILPLLENEAELHDAIEQILFAEERSVEELLQLM